MGTPLGNTGRDRLARMLRAVRMRSTFYTHSELTEPWALEMPAIADSVSFHVVTKGRCWVRLPAGNPVQLTAGDLALIPHGRGHDLLHSPDSRRGPRVDLLPQEYLSPHYSVLRHGGSGAASQLICGIVSFEDPAARELMRSLPEILLVSSELIPTSSAIRDTLRLMAQELHDSQPGGEAVATRLADILIVQAIRSWVASQLTAERGWLRGLDDERIGRTLEAIHADPGRRWGLECQRRSKGGPFPAAEKGTTGLWCLVCLLLEAGGR